MKTTVTRQQLIGCISVADATNYMPPLMRAILLSDIINVTPQLVAQLRAMYPKHQHQATYDAMTALLEIST
jgi:DNA-directed RNA polymerase subunit F